MNSVLDHSSGVIVKLWYKISHKLDTLLSKMLTNVFLSTVFVYGMLLPNWKDFFFYDIINFGRTGFLHYLMLFA